MIGILTFILYIKQKKAVVKEQLPFFITISISLLISCFKENSNFSLHVSALIAGVIAALTIFRK